MNAIYLLNSPVLTGYGDWRFEGPLSIDRAREVVRSGFTSAIGHPGAASLLTAMLGIEVPVLRVAISMQRGDQALVLRLTQRLDAGAMLSDEQLLAIPHELGLLTRLQ